MTAIVFDLDGTLVDSAPDIHGAVNKTLVQNNHPVLSLETVKSFVGNGVPRLIERVMSETKIAMAPSLHAQLTKEFSVFYAANPVDKTHMYKGVLTLLERLSASGCKLAVCTNKPLDLTTQVLTGLKIGHFFGAVIGGDSLKVKKPDPAPLLKVLELLGVESCIYVGDSEVDADTAQNAGQPFFLYTKGYRKKPANQITAKTRFDHFDALFGLIEQHEKNPLGS